MYSRHAIVIALIVVFGCVLLAGCPRPAEEPVKMAPSALPPAGGAGEPSETYKVVISTRPGQWNLDERVRGYEETFAGDYPQIEVIQVIDDETSAEAGARQAGAVLAAHPEIDAFVGINANSGPGAADAVKAAGRDGEIVIVAMDADSAILDSIENDVITGSVAQRQYYMTYIGVKYLYGLNHGYFRRPGDTEADQSLPEIPEVIDTGTVEVNAGNIALFRTDSQGAKEEFSEKHPEWLELLSDRDPSEVEPGEEYVTLGISTGAEYWNATEKGLEDVAEELGVAQQFDGPLGHLPEEQANKLDQIIARRPAGILIAPGDPDTLKPYIDKAIDEGIPVICIDTDSPDSKRIAYFGTSNYEAGVTGAHILAKALMGE